MIRKMFLLKRWLKKKEKSGQMGNATQKYKTFPVRSQKGVAGQNKLLPLKTTAKDIPSRQKRIRGGTLRW